MERRRDNRCRGGKFMAADVVDGMGKKDREKSDVGKKSVERATWEWTGRIRWGDTTTLSFFLVV